MGFWVSRTKTQGWRSCRGLRISQREKTRVFHQYLLIWSSWDWSRESPRRSTIKLALDLWEWKERWRSTVRQFTCFPDKNSLCFLRNCQLKLGAMIKHWVEWKKLGRDSIWDPLGIVWEEAATCVLLQSWGWDWGIRSGDIEEEVMICSQPTYFSGLWELGAELKQPVEREMLGGEGLWSAQEIWAKEKGVWSMFLL